MSTRPIARTAKLASTLASRSLPALLCAAALGSAVLSTSAQATTGYQLRGEFPTNIGIDAKSVAVDPSSSDVYVATPFTSAFTAGLVEQFSSSGALLASFSGLQSTEFSGVAVDPATHDVYAYDSNNQTIDAFNATGQPADVFAEGASASLPVIGHVEVQIASDPAGDIYYPNQALEEVQEFLPDGTSGPVTITGLTRPTDVAVSSTAIYVVDSNSSSGAGQVQRFDSSGAPVGTGVLGGGVLSNPKAVAVDAAGDAFVVDNSPDGIVVDEFDATGALTRTFAADVEARTGVSIAVNAADEAYLLEDRGASHGPVSIFAPSSVTAPSASTGAPVGVEPSVETVTGAVDPEGTDATYRFEYGTNTAYGQSAPSPDADAGTGTTSVAAEATLSSLEPNQTYHYRLVATNAEGDRAYGADRTFTTAAAPPGVGGESVSSVTGTDAVLAAQIQPNNEATTYYFRYGTSPTLAGATAAPAPPGTEVGAGFGEYRVSQDIGGGLTPDTTYYYQALATNATNASEGPIESFTTLPPAPGAETDTPSSITETTATLTAMLRTQDIPTTYSFQYVDGADFERTGYQDATSVPQPELYAEGSSQAIIATAFAGGLTPDTTYHVRLVADSAGGFTEGTEQVFTTVVLPPSLSSGLPVSIAPTVATVNGSVNPEHGATTYRFEYVARPASSAPGTGTRSACPSPKATRGRRANPSS